LVYQGKAGEYDSPMTLPSDSTVSRFAELGVNVAQALDTLATIPVSMPCWQFDDVTGLEGGHLEGGGIAATGNYPGKPRNGDELRQDIELALRLCPGSTRLNLHACYAETGGQKVDRDAYTPEHFRTWIDWAKRQSIALDFNPTCFAHPGASDGFTLSHADPGIRQFWIDHCQSSRRIGEAFGRELGSRCTVNVWIPDGFKDVPADRLAPRERLLSALDKSFAEDLDPGLVEDAVESKLFGIGSEAYVTGSFEFYYGYAMKHGKLLCLDAGHFHPTETITDKFSSVLLYVPAVLCHLTRGLRWDSDHVLVLDDGTRAAIDEIVGGGYLDRVRLGLDYFDASINRIAAGALGVRTARKALMMALLTPHAKLRELERDGNYTGRLCLREQLRTLPYGDVWEAFCAAYNVPGEADWLQEIRSYEQREFPGRQDRPA
jgi:L-rhamnose isomerase